MGNHPPKYPKWGIADEFRQCEVPTWDIWADGCPRGETPAQVSLRADRLISRLLSMDGKLALFSHGQFAQALAARWIGLPVIQGRHFALDPASLSILSVQSKYAQRHVIELWNATTLCRPQN